MAYIGKVTLTDTWTKLEDLIKLLDGQSDFAFDTSKQYQIQVDTVKSNHDYSAYFCSSATEPTEADAGEHLDNNLPAIYQPESGMDLWVKMVNAGVVKVSVSELGTISTLNDIK